MSAAGALLAGVRILLILAVAARVSGRRLPPAAVWAVSLLALVAVLASAFGADSYSVDARVFWTAGRDVRDGADPYARPELLNPPSALPFFVILSLLPLSAFLVFWKVAGLAGYGALVPLSRGALRGAPGETTDEIAPTDLLLLSAAVLASVAAQFGVLIGQLPFVTALASIGAVGCRAKGRPVAAGLLLAVAAIKITTMLPLLLLFLRRQDLKTWATLALSGFALAFLAVRPTQLAEVLRRNWSNISLSNAPGATNDYSFAGPHSADLVGLNLAVYHLGVRDRTLVDGLSLVIVALLGLWVAWQLYRRPALAHAPAAAIVTCYASIFVYHRVYDTVLLALPLVYAFSRGLVETGRARWGYRACALGLLGVLFEPVKVLERFQRFSQGHGLAGRMVEALCLPAATWILLAAVVGLTLVERRRRTAAAS